MISKQVKQKIIELITNFTELLPVDDHLFEKNSKLIRQDIDKLVQSIVDMVVEKLKSESIMEYCAHLEHERWSKWQKYIHSKIIPTANDSLMEIGTEWINRWNRQIATPYTELSELEKESDREQVRPYLEFIINSLKQD